MAEEAEFRTTTTSATKAIVQTPDRGPVVTGVAPVKTRYSDLAIKQVFKAYSVSAGLVGPGQTPSATNVVTIANFRRLINDCPGLLTEDFPESRAEQAFIEATGSADTPADFTTFVQAMSLLASAKYAEEALTPGLAMSMLLANHVFCLPTMVVTGSASRRRHHSHTHTHTHSATNVNTSSTRVERTLDFDDSRPSRGVTVKVADVRTPARGGAGAGAGAGAAAGATAAATAAAAATARGNTHRPLSMTPPSDKKKRRGGCMCCGIWCGCCQLCAALLGLLLLGLLTWLALAAWNVFAAGGALGALGLASVWKEALAMLGRLWAAIWGGGVAAATQIVYSVPCTTCGLKNVAM